MIGRDGHHVREAHLKNVDIVNVHVKEVDATTRVVAHTEMEDPEVAIVIFLEQVALVIVLAIITPTGQFQTIKLLPTIFLNNLQLKSLLFYRSNRPRNKSPDNSGDPSESSKRK